MLQTFAPGAARRADLWEIVAAGLRRAIITGELAPGLRLREEVLAQKFAVSRIPVREALTRLEHEGFIRSEPRRGAFVVGMSPADVHEVYDVREMIETRAVRLAVERADRNDVDRLQHLIDQMAAAVRRGRHADVVEPDVTFHRDIIAAARHKRLLATWEPVSGVVAGLLEITNTSHPNMPAAIATHQAIVDAMRAGDAQAAEKAVVQHLRNGERIMQIALARLRMPQDEAAAGG